MSLSKCNPINVKNSLLLHHFTTHIKSNGLAYTVSMFSLPLCELRYISLLARLYQAAESCVPMAMVCGVVGGGAVAL